MPSRNPFKVSAARAFLLTRVTDDWVDLPTYGDLGAAIGEHPRAVNHVLYSVYDECMANGEPDLTLLVVNKTTRIPSHGASMQIDYDRPQSVQDWQAERAWIAAWNW